MNWKKVPRPHPLLLALLAFGLATGQAPQVVIYLLTLFLHEACHSVAARSLGFQMGRVDLYPFGGHAEIPGIELRGPLAEALVAMAGPLGNFAGLALGTALWRFGLGDPQRARLIVDANFIMIAVNALPAFPLDGGRILRAYRAAQSGIGQATAEAIRLTRALSVLLLAIGGIGQLAGYPGWQLVVLAVVLLSAAGGEERRVPYARWTLWLRALESLRRGEVLPLQSLAAGRGSELRYVLHRLFGQRAHRVYVFDQGKFLGALDDDQLYRAARKGELHRTLGEIVRERDQG